MSSTVPTSGQAQTYDHMFKLVMIGEAGVGKSSILLRFTDDRFEEDHLSTIGVDLRVKFLDVNKKKIKMVIWDTAGTLSFLFLVCVCTESPSLDFMRSDIAANLYKHGIAPN
jgi:small GTP-binding protein